MKYKFSVNFDSLSLLSEKTGYTGNKETYDCGFAFSKEWDGYEKFITIIQNGKTYTDKLTDDSYVMPLLEVGTVKIGLFGTTEGGARRICTNFLEIRFESGSYSTAEPPVPAPDVWQQYVEELTTKLSAESAALEEKLDEKAAELEKSFSQAAQEIMEAKVPKKATELQANEGTDDEAFLTPLQGKNQFNTLIAGALTNTPEFYIKESVEAMNGITSMKNGDICIILSGDTTAQSIYRYYTHDINGSDITDTWVWMTDLSLFAPQPVLALSDGVWDYALGNSAKITLNGETKLQITNVYSGAYGVLDVYGGEPTLPENSYAFPPDWDYLKPKTGQHWRYSFYYDGNKFDWNRSVRNDE